MELLLLKDVEQVGKKGDVINVRDGFARNFLIPQKLALSATRANKDFFGEQRNRTAVRKAKEKELAEEKAKELRNLKISMAVRVGKNDKLYGSITAEDIARALAQQGHSFEKRQIRLREPLRSLGVNKVDLELCPQVKATVSVELVREK